MSANFRQPPNAGAEAVIVSKSITANGTYNASSDNADGYNPVTVNVPGPTILSKNITANGTYNASSDSADGYDPVTVNVPSHNTIMLTRDPLSNDGDNGDTFIKYNNQVNVELKTTISGGYNGGAVLKCLIDNTEILSAIGTSPYNLDYDNKTASVTIHGKTISVVVTPPANNTSDVIITWYIDGVSAWVVTFHYTGSNTSYGYGDQSDTQSETLTSEDNKIINIYYKQSGTWLTIGNSIVI